MTEEYYRPTIIQPKDLDIDGTDYNADLNVIKEGNTIKVTMDQDVMIQRVSHEIYSNFESGIRELINNEYRACRQARDKYNAKPRLEVTINARTRELTIEGIDSLGISVRVFDKVLRRLGVSGNVDGGNEIGQFGMGFASYTTLSELINVETYSREDNQEFAFLGDRGIDFKILPKPERETFGTKLSVTCKEDVYWGTVINKIKSCALFSTIPTTIVVTDDGKEDGYSSSYYDDIDEGVFECDVYNSGKEYCRTTYEKDCSHQHDKLGQSTDGLCSNDYAVGFHKEIHIDNDDYEFYGIISVAKMHRIITGQARSGSRFEIRLVNTPIQSEIKIAGNWTGYYLNIKDERKFVPTADRDRLKDESSRLISSLLATELKKHFTGLGIKTIDDYNRSLHKCVLDNLYIMKDVMPETDYEESTSVMQTLDHRFPTINNRRVQLREVLTQGKQLVVLKSLRADMMARLSGSLGEESDKPLVFVRWRAGDWTGSHGDNESIMGLFDEINAIFGEQYIKDNKVKGIKTKGDTVKTLAEEAGCVVYHQGNHQRSGLFGTDTGYYITKYSTTVGAVNNSVNGENTASSINTKKCQDNIMTVHKDDWNNFFVYAMDQNRNIPFCILKPRKGFHEKIESYTDKKEEYKTRKFQTLGGIRQSIDELFPLSEDRWGNMYSRPKTVILVVVNNKKEREAVSDMFSNEDMTKDDCTNVILCESNKELMCLHAYINERKTNVGVETYNAHGFLNLVQPSKIGNCHNKDIMTDKDSSEWKSIMKMEAFRRSVPDNIYSMVVHAIKDESDLGVKYMKAIYDYGDQQRLAGDKWDKEHD